MKGMAALGIGGRQAVQAAGQLATSGIAPAIGPIAATLGNQYPQPGQPITMRERGPAWELLRDAYDKARQRKHDRIAYTGGIDLDIRALRSVSDAHKIGMQRRRDDAEETTLQQLYKLVWD